ncbi:hypothetical protein SNEBB_009131 [Seison nebaliae]|nr:hypothetical protein SNEBB_009131 [Seison nebaliae]
MKAYSKMKDLVKNSGYDVSNAYAVSVENLSDEIIKELPELSVIKRTLHRVRNSIIEKIPVAENILFQIPKSISNLNDENIIKFDNKQEKRSIFISIDSAIDSLKKAEHID